MLLAAVLWCGQTIVQSRTLPAAARQRSGRGSGHGSGHGSGGGSGGREVPIGRARRLHVVVVVVVIVDCLRSPSSVQSGEAMRRIKQTVHQPGHELRSGHRCIRLAQLPAHLAAAVARVTAGHGRRRRRCAGALGWRALAARKDRTQPRAAVAQEAAPISACVGELGKGCPSANAWRCAAREDVMKHHRGARPEAHECDREQQQAEHLLRAAAGGSGRRWR